MRDLINSAFDSFSIAPAVEFQGTVVSRAEIAGRSDRLAEWLVDHGAGSGCLAGIFIERSVEMLIGILGVMKAGAAYVPIAVLPLQPSGSGTPIFVIPQMLIFRTLAEELGAEEPFYALQLPDDDVPDALASVRFEELAALYCEQIRAVQPEGPTGWGVWCLWDWMAYEVARRLEAEGAEIEMLAIMDAWAPGYWRRYPPGAAVVCERRSFLAEAALVRREHEEPAGPAAHRRWLAAVAGDGYGSRASAATRTAA